MQPFSSYSLHIFEGYKKCSTNRRQNSPFLGIRFYGTNFFGIAQKLARNADVESMDIKISQMFRSFKTLNLISNLNANPKELLIHPSSLPQITGSLKNSERIMRGV